MVTRDGKKLVIAVLGLGEAGSVIARDLTAAGTRVRGYDPAVTAAGPVLDTAGEAEAAREAQLVLSVNSAKAAVAGFPDQAETDPGAPRNPGPPPPGPAGPSEGARVAADRPRSW